MTRKRTEKRSRSGAHVKCPQCKKRLRGDKGLAHHLMTAHGIKVAVPTRTNRRVA